VNTFQGVQDTDGKLYIMRDGAFQYSKTTYMNPFVPVQDMVPSEDKLSIYVTIMDDTIMVNLHEYI
jgi:hypothetical protein